MTADRVALARAKKAGALAEVLRQKHVTLSQVEAVAADPEARAAVEYLAGTRPASDQTWDAVVALFRGAASIPTDPFAGLPGC